MFIYIVLPLQDKFNVTLKKKSFLNFYKCNDSKAIFSKPHSSFSSNSLSSPFSRYSLYSITYIGSSISCNNVIWTLIILRSDTCIMVIVMVKRIFIWITSDCDLETDVVMVNKIKVKTQLFFRCICKTLIN